MVTTKISPVSLLKVNLSHNVVVRLAADEDIDGCKDVTRLAANDVWCSTEVERCQEDVFGPAVTSLPLGKKPTRVSRK